MTEPEQSPKSIQIVHRHSDDVHSEDIIYSATLAHSLNEEHSINSHRELIVPSSASGQHNLDLTRPLSSREVAVSSTQQPPDGRRNCASWCFSWFFPTRQTAEQESSPLLPVYQVRSNESGIRVEGITDNLIDFLQRWLFRVVRRQYPNTFSWLAATLLTVVLISGILALYYTGNLTGLVILARTLICSIIRQFQPADIALPSFCRAV
ncbi:hypothetical protein G210_4484 [Candida maltosa Xu316]|uniref:Uncharacterized protein n=1 Tax=Candida maltosa (strain Xu316) TaxID=1245528 RepID=M3JRD5_CANMX|nr:hypothetical protein G210_4484 [Candida maltosa Xu316]